MDSHGRHVSAVVLGRVTVKVLTHYAVAVYGPIRDHTRTQ